MMKFCHEAVPVMGSSRQVMPSQKIRMSANQKLGSAWPTTARVRARRSIMVLGRIAASTPSGIDSTRAKPSAQAPSSMVVGRRSKMTPATSRLR